MLQGLQSLQGLQALQTSQNLQTVPTFWRLQAYILSIEFAHFAKSKNLQGKFSHTLKQVPFGLQVLQTFKVSNFVNFAN